MRVLILLAKKMDPATYQQALDGVIPRPEYLVLQEALGADLLDFTDVEGSEHPAVVRARRVGPRFGLAVLGFLRRKDYDHLYCTGEDVAFPLAMLMTAVADLGRITAVVHHTGTPKRRAIMRAIPSAAWRNIICLGMAQHRVLTVDNHLPGSLVHRFPYWVDTRFFDPDLAEAPDGPGYVLACGRESRDYPTLGEAAAGSTLPYRVIASGWDPLADHGVTETARATGNVVVEGGGLSFAELRSRYAGARVVVVPLHDVDYSAGVTTVLEAMCMAKPVVASRSAGIVDYVEDGASGVVTPVGDPIALRTAIEALHRDSGRAASIGARNQASARERYAVERHAARVAGLYGMEPQIGPLHHRAD